MTRISIDASVESLDLSGLHSLGEALNKVMELVPESRFITEIELDGKKMKLCVSTSEMNRELESVHEVKVITADRQQWSANGFDVALSALQKIQRTLIVTAEFFRDGENLEGNRLLARCMDGLERFWDAVSMTRAALSIPFQEIMVSGVFRLSDLETQFIEIVRGFVSLQEAQAYEDLADKIEYELIPHLSRWSEGINFLAKSYTGNA